MKHTLKKKKMLIKKKFRTNVIANPMPDPDYRFEMPDPVRIRNNNNTSLRDTIRKQNETG